MNKLSFWIELLLIFCLGGSLLFQMFSELKTTTKISSATIKKQTTVNETLAKQKILKQPDFLYAAGGWDFCNKNNRLTAWQKNCHYQQVKTIDSLIRHKKIPLNSISIWITRGWQEDWYPAADINQKLIQQGITPIFIFYWYADEISKEFVLENQPEMDKDLTRFTQYLKKIKGNKFVVLHPEFNQGDINQWEGFNRLLSNDIKKVKKVADTQVGFCVGDFGDYDKVNEPQEWALFHDAIKDAAKVTDFIAFQEMRAITRNKPQHIANTPQRSLNFAKYLNETYNKPTFYAYLALSSFGKDGEQRQAKVVKETLQLMPQFKREAGLIGFNLFHLMDSPRQVGYFKEAEKYFGIYRADGSAKPSAKYFIPTKHDSAQK